LKSFVLMIQFLTRIPISIELQVERKDFENGTVYFPVVGALIGLMLLGIYKVLFGIVSPFLLALIIVIAEVLITGGLHLDGLSDTFDGIYSNRDKERILEIMKDSRLGANGALALFFFMLLKLGLIMELDSSIAMTVIFLMPVFARMNIVLACRYSKYAREDGMGNFFIGKVSNVKLVLTGLFTLIMTLGNLNSMILLITSVLFAFYYMDHVRKIIDGMTGDTLGALCELSEIWILLIAVIIQKI